MLKTKMKDGTLLFLPNDYDDALLDVVGEVMGEDIANLLCDMLERDAVAHADALADAEAVAAKANRRARELAEERDNAIALLDAERTAHAAEIADLEEELQNLAAMKDLLWNTNEQLLLRLKGYGWTAEEENA